MLGFFFGVNSRNGEGAHTEWHDIDFDQKEVSIYSKEQKYAVKCLSEFDRLA